MNYIQVCLYLSSCRNGIYLCIIIHYHHDSYCGSFSCSDYNLEFLNLSLYKMDPWPQKVDLSFYIICACLCFLLCSFKCTFMCNLSWISATLLVSIIKIVCQRRLLMLWSVVSTNITAVEAGLKWGLFLSGVIQSASALVSTATCIERKKHMCVIFWFQWKWWIILENQSVGVKHQGNEGCERSRGRQRVIVINDWK